MNNEERIEKLILTLKHIDNALTYLSQMPMDERVRDSINDIKDSIKKVIDKNLDDLVEL